MRKKGIWESCRPQYVSIGPYHLENIKFLETNHYKVTNRKEVLTRTGKPLMYFVNLMRDMDEKIRNSYSQSLDRFTPLDLAKLMVLDGLFLIEIFRKVGKVVYIDPHDAILKIPFLRAHLTMDMLRLENQIPFFVLQTLFDESGGHPGEQPHTLKSLVFGFFSHLLAKPTTILNQYESFEAPHVLDFIRQCSIYSEKRNTITYEAQVDSELIQKATKLNIAGVRFKVNHNARSFLDIEFQHGHLFIPKMKMDDFHASFLLNCVAFEQLYIHCSNDITTYIVFMRCLMDNSADVDLLLHNEIIDNYLGSGADILKLFNSMGKYVAFDVKGNYLSGLFIQINRYCKNRWKAGWGGFKYTYFRSPWFLISAIAVSLGLGAALLQTVYTILSYYQ